MCPYQVTYRYPSGREGFYVTEADCPLTASFKAGVALAGKNFCNAVLVIEVLSCRPLAESEWFTYLAERSVA
jgi:hypothetical protein